MEISNKAKKHINQQGAVVTIEFNGICGCCVPIYIALAETKEPANPDSYRKFCLDGIIIYYPEGAVIDEKLFKIDMISTNTYSRLEVVGIDRET